jgi:lysine 2,3-aminomutase
VPTYVVDGLHGAGKIPVMPNYVVSASDNAVILRNYEGLLFRYQPEDRPESAGHGYQTLGVSSLLSGTRDVLVPDGTPRMERRHDNGSDSADGQPADVIQITGYQMPDSLEAARTPWARLPKAK